MRGNSNLVAGSPLINNLSELLAGHVQSQGERIAIGTSDLKTVLTYRQLDTLVGSAVAQLSCLGLNRGDTIVLISDNSLEFAVGLLAVVSSGARAAPLNPALTLRELSTRVSTLSAHAVLTAKHQAAQLESWIPVSPKTTRWYITIEGSGVDAAVKITDREGRTQEPDAVAGTGQRFINGGDVALVLFTAGSTSAPKAVPLTHRNVVESIWGISHVYDLAPADATLLVMPLFHGHGLVAGLLATLASGGSAFFPSSGAFSAHVFWSDMARVGATWYTAVPTIHRILLNRAPQEYPNSSPVPLRFIRSCSAPLDKELAAETAAAFRAPVISAYGMTETCHQATSNPLPAHGSNKTSSVGLPTGVELRIVADDGTDAASGSTGEIWVRGPTVTPGYLNDPSANSASFVHGWFRSGDLGSRDADGYLFVKGRLKDVINRGGEKISPNDVDTVLLSNPKVLEGETFGEPDPMYGEVVHAAVVLRPGVKATESELKDYCRSMLSSFEIPEHIHIVESFPLTAKGSIDKRALAAQFSLHTQA